MVSNNIYDQLIELKNLQSDLVLNLNEKNVEAKSEEGFNTLIPKVRNIKTGVELPITTTAIAENIFYGKTAYNNLGTLLTGTALSNTTTASAGDILKNKTAYNNSGTLLTGTGANLSNTVYGGPLPTSGSTTIDFGFKPKCVMLCYVGFPSSGIRPCASSGSAINKSTGSWDGTVGLTPITVTAPGWSGSDAPTVIEASFSGTKMYYTIPDGTAEYQVHNMYYFAV